MGSSSHSMLPETGAIGNTCPRPITARSNEPTITLSWHGFLPGDNVSHAIAQIKLAGGDLVPF